MFACFDRSTCAQNGENAGVSGNQEGSGRTRLLYRPASLEWGEDPLERAVLASLWLTRQQPFKLYALNLRF